MDLCLSKEIDNEYLFTFEFYIFECTVALEFQLVDVYRLKNNRRGVGIPEKGWRYDNAPMPLPIL